MSRSLAERILQAASGASIPAGNSGLWYVRKWQIAKPLSVFDARGKSHVCPPGSYTNLMRYTMASLHNGGDLVMHDVPYELKKHLGFMLKAKGRVLISGLGLGCVVRGCLANPFVEHVTVVENSKDVLALVWRYMPVDRRCNLIFGDALGVAKRVKKGEYDCAWHDLWLDETPDDEGAKKKPHLQSLHMELICDLVQKVELQGAWEFPRYFRKIMHRSPFQVI